MGILDPAALSRLRLASTAFALLAVCCGTCVLIGCGLVPQQTTQQAPAQTYAITDLKTGESRDMQVQVAAPPAPSPTPGLRIELTDVAAIGSISTAAIALILALTARRRTNGLARRLDTWPSSPPAP